MHEIGGGKRKLTLSVDEEVIDKAKTLGLNLSEITEAVLRGFAFAPDQTEKDALYSKYKELCDSMLPLLKEYDTSVKVAEETMTDSKGFDQGTVDINLQPDGTFWVDVFEATFSDIKKLNSYDFLEPTTILSNFITVIANAKERRKERLEELEMVKKIVSAITESTKSRKILASDKTTLVKKRVEV